MSPPNVDVNDRARASDADAPTLIAAITLELKESNGYVYSYKKLSSLIGVSVYFTLTMEGIN